MGKSGFLNQKNATPSFKKHVKNTWKKYRGLKGIRKFLANLLLVSVSLFLLGLLLNKLFPLPDAPPTATLVTDRDGKILHAFIAADDQWRVNATMAEISPLLKKTIIYKEDKYFYYHPGVNPAAIIRAFARNIFTSGRRSGASTITMQVAKMLEPKKRNFFNKLRESLRALQLEWTYSKDDILQLYFNLLPYGGNIIGIKTASLLYFNKNPDHLSLAEITAMSIIPNKPGKLVIGRHNEAITQQRNQWLQRMAKAGIFSEKEIEDALQEPLTANRGRFPKMAGHLSYKIRRSGEGILATTLHQNTQLKIEKLVQDYVRTLQSSRIGQAAVVVMDNKTRQVVAYVGSANFFDSSQLGEVNGAAAIRQPGSTLKPLLYGLAIDAGLITPKMLITDVAVNYGGYTPENYDQQFNGLVSMQYALAQSLNIPAVKLLNALGKDKMIETLIQCNFNQVRKDQRKLGLSLILGGCGNTLEELTGLFCAIANRGQYTKPVFLKQDTLLQTKQILSEGACYMLTDILSNMQRPDFPIHWQTTASLPRIAWKTGTSYGRRDAWSMGYNQQYTVGVWAGNFSGEGVAELSGAQIATPLLFKIFNSIDYNSSTGWFQQPEDCQIRTVCSETGLPPADFCTNLINDFYLPLVSPNRICNNKQQIFTSPDDKTSYCLHCRPAIGYKTTLIARIPPEMEAYYTEKQMAFEKVPPHFTGCEKLFEGNGPKIESPAHGAEYFIDKTDPQPLQLKCQAGSDVNRVFWYINKRFFKAGLPAEKIYFVPDYGPNHISVTDDKGRQSSVQIMVKRE